MTLTEVSLRAFTHADLPIVASWFRDPDTRPYLGGPDWPAAMLEHGERALGETFRGAVQTAAHRYLAELDGLRSATSTAARLTAPPPRAHRDPTGRSSPTRSRWRPGRSRSPSTRLFAAAELGA